ncbi:methyltransferase domain-containing protein [Vagococcus humatus]|uniref:50S rRNA methyltransferase n=1 Tax=Vagococcus humatus TaxID=1889241 RepID=A0A3R9ZY25_9ENTE|nr:methyltransferase domain-containing protein [Vagococcus humatus]RST90359.1 50S rRNA methyltransferase [Vagococcus humatus]
MRQKKIDKALTFLEKNYHVFACPVCQQKFNYPTDYSLVCENNHRFNLSKKGTVYFLSHQVQTDYNEEMLKDRQKMIELGLYEPMLKVIYQHLPETANPVTVDVGCGEGSFLKQLMDMGLEGTNIGFDLSKDGIQLATQHDLDAFFCVADLTHLPFDNQQVDCLLNIFSPSHYEEFQRVLTEDGCVLKIIPEEFYLKELREVFFKDQPEKQHYSNALVREKFSQEMNLVHDQRITYQFSIPKTHQQAALKMSPMHWGATCDMETLLDEAELDYLTVDVRLLAGKGKK